MSEQKRTPTMITIREAAKRTGLTPYTVRKICWQGKVATLKTGRKWMLNYESLCDLLEQGDEIA